jgi:hypothetical protein
LLSNGSIFNFTQPSATVAIAASRRAMIVRRKNQRQRTSAIIGVITLR